MEGRRYVVGDVDRAQLLVALLVRQSTIALRSSSVSRSQSFIASVIISVIV